MREPIISFTNARYFAHTLAGRSSEDWELLPEHLREVAELAETFATAFRSGAWGLCAGWAHDIGKFSAAFQNYLRLAADPHSAEITGKTDHSTAGAQHVVAACGPMGKLLAYALAGHHAGLPDWRSDAGISGLIDRLRKDVEPWQKNAGSTLPTLALSAPRFHASSKDRVYMAFKVNLFLRMVFSALVDADFLCTEAFMSPGKSAMRESAGAAPFGQLELRLIAHLAMLSSGAVGKVNALRQQVLAACILAADRPQGLFSLPVPTGGGKTLASMRFALRHARRHDLRRVIVAIPFTSVIEQNVEVYRDAFGDVPIGSVLEHHSNLAPDKETTQTRLLAENWDAPIVVTTNVQLFESLFASRTSRCRKLHRIANSVIILDEAQTLPVELLHATLLAIRELVDEYGCTIVLCSATQPAIAHSAEFPIGLHGVEPIVSETDFGQLQRVRVERAGLLMDEDLYAQVLEQDQVLLIVNTRRHAASLFGMMGDETGHFHLSTRMCGKHRSNTITELRRRLDAGDVCRVVSTQLIEAGVDVDFPVVYRAACGLDSLVQSAGRCNREGKRESGRVVWFETEHPPPAGHLRRAADAAREVAEPGAELLSPAIIRRYFAHYYWDRRDRWDAHDVLGCLPQDPNTMEFYFREMSQRYRIIREEGVGIVVPFDAEGVELIDAMLEPFPPSRKTWRALQRYVVTVHTREHEALYAAGALQDCHGLWVLLQKDLYDSKQGILLDELGDGRLAIEDSII